MNHEQFCWWLGGVLSTAPAMGMLPTQVNDIRKQLASVLAHGLGGQSILEPPYLAPAVTGARPFTRAGGLLVCRSCGYGSTEELEHIGQNRAKEQNQKQRAHDMQMQANAQSSDAHSFIARTSGLGGSR